jgi:hypothetical protein
MGSFTVHVGEPIRQFADQTSIARVAATPQMSRRHTILIIENRECVEE